MIPTCRLRDVGETVERYDEHFRRNGHSVRMIVFDDSSPSSQAKYYPVLEQTKTHNDLYYVGPREKEQFLAYLHKRLRDKRLEGLVKDLFRPSYGGNRNFTLIYTLGGLVVSCDDDMRPFTFMEDSPESLGVDEVCRGKLIKAGTNWYTRKSFDILTAFLDVLGKPVKQVPDNYERGELLMDSATDLETNASVGPAMALRRACGSICGALGCEGEGLGFRLELRLGQQLVNVIHVDQEFGGGTRSRVLHGNPEIGANPCRIPAEDDNAIREHYCFLDIVSDQEDAAPYAGIILRL